MYFTHNIYLVLLKFNSYSLIFPVTLRISCEQSLWVRGENTSLVLQSVKVGKYNREARPKLFFTFEQKNCQTLLQRVIRLMEQLTSLETRFSS